MQHILRRSLEITVSVDDERVRLLSGQLALESDALLRTTAATRRAHFNFEATGEYSPSFPGVAEQPPYFEATKAGDDVWDIKSFLAKPSSNPRDVIMNEIAYGLDVKTYALTVRSLSRKFFVAADSRGKFPPDRSPPRTAVTASAALNGLVYATRGLYGTYRRWPHFWDVE